MAAREEPPAHRSTGSSLWEKVLRGVSSPLQPDHAIHSAARHSRADGSHLETDAANGLLGDSLDSLGAESASDYYSESDSLSCRTPSPLDEAVRANASTPPAAGRIPSPANASNDAAVQRQQERRRKHRAAKGGIKKAKTASPTEIEFSSSMASIGERQELEDGAGAEQGSKNEPKNKKTKDERWAAMATAAAARAAVTAATVALHASREAAKWATRAQKKRKKQLDRIPDVHEVVFREKGAIGLKFRDADTARGEPVGGVVVKRVTAGRQADRHDVGEGDRLVVLNGESVRGLGKEEVDKLLRACAKRRPLAMAFELAPQSDDDGSASEQEGDNGEQEGGGGEGRGGRQDGVGHRRLRSGAPPSGLHGAAESTTTATANVGTWERGKGAAEDVPIDNTSRAAASAAEAIAVAIGAGGGDGGSALSSTGKLFRRGHGHGGSMDSVTDISGGFEAIAPNNSVVEQLGGTGVGTAADDQEAAKQRVGRTTSLFTRNVRAEDGRVELESGADGGATVYEVRFSANALGLGFVVGADRCSFVVNKVGGQAKQRDVRVGDRIECVAGMVVGKHVGKQALANMIRTAKRPLAVRFRRPPPGDAAGAVSPARADSESVLLGNTGMQRAGMDPRLIQSQSQSQSQSARQALPSTSMPLLPEHERVGAVACVGRSNTVTHHPAPTPGSRASGAGAGRDRAGNTDSADGGSSVDGARQARATAKPAPALSGSVTRSLEHTRGSDDDTLNQTFTDDPTENRVVHELGRATVLIDAAEAVELDSSEPCMAGGAAGLFACGGGAGGGGGAHFIVYVVTITMHGAGTWSVRRRYREFRSLRRHLGDEAAGIRFLFPRRTPFGRQCSEDEVQARKTRLARWLQRTLKLARAASLTPEQSRRLHVFLSPDDPDDGEVRHRSGTGRGTGGSGGSDRSDSSFAAEQGSGFEPQHESRESSTFDDGEVVCFTGGGDDDAAAGLAARATKAPAATHVRSESAHSCHSDISVGDC
eukprot:g1680.t1